MLGIILLGFFITDIIAVLFLHYKVHLFLSKQTFNSTADAGVVFYVSDTKRMLYHAIRLYRTRKIKHIICVGGSRVNKEFSGSQEMRSYLIKHGINADNVLHDTLSYDTRTNWYEALKIIDRHHFNKIVIISSPLHVYRISRIVDRDNVYYSSYTHEEQTILDYLIIYKNIHYYWTTLILAKILSKKNYLRILYWYRNR